MPIPAVSFNHGLASGDPHTDSVILWTRITPPTDFTDTVDVQWELASNPDFDQDSLMDSGSFATSADRDWTVKVEADGLTADTDYHFRFRVGDVVSMVGQTKTLTVGSDPVRLAVFSCANYTADEQFAAYGRAADIHAANPYDALLHLGDYIYEYGPGGYGAAEDAAADRGFLPNREIISLNDYRERYAQYHTDTNLQNLRAAAPLIAIWDDHETANDSWVGGAQNHQSNSEGVWTERRDAALKAYYEWLPIREPDLRQASDGATALSPLTQGYRSFNFGDVLALHMLETRLTARDEQLAYPDAAAVQARIGLILADPALVAAYATQLSLTVPSSPAAIPAFAAALAPAVTQELVLATVQQAWGDPNRDLIGDDQLAWLQQQMAGSNAAWQVLGQQVLMQSMAVPAELLLDAGNPALLDKYATPLQKLATGTAFADLSAAEKALFSEAGKIPYNLDAWDGYGVERETILQTALGLGKRLISLAGDTHNAWAGKLETMAPTSVPAGTVAGVEFATPGVTSPGLEKYLPGADTYIRAAYPAVDGLDGLFSGYVNGLIYADLNRRGFLDLSVSADEAIGNFQFLDGVNAFTGLPRWASETVVASSNFGLNLEPEATPQITWQPNWRELDLVFGLVTETTGGQILLNPADFATLARAGIQLADVAVLGSDTEERLFVGIGSTIDAAGGIDELFNTDSQGLNILAGGAGGDIFYLVAADDRVIGGSIASNPNPTGSSPFLAQPDAEADRFNLAFDGFTPDKTLTILDYEVGIDQILVEGKPVTEEWLVVKQSLTEHGFLINASPSVRSSWSTSPLRIAAGERIEIPASEICSDPDGDNLAIDVLAGPNWITSSGNSLVIAAPEQLVQADLSTPIRVALSDGMALVPLVLELVVDEPALPAVVAPAGSIIQSSDSDGDGLREVEVALDGNPIDGNNDGIPDAQQRNVAGIRLINDGARAADYGALEVAAEVQLRFNSDPLILASSDEKYSFTGRDGEIVSIALPQNLTNRFAGAIAFEVTDLTTGGDTNANVCLPQSVTISDPNQNAYIRYNYSTGRFEEYLNIEGDPHYAFIDRNSDGTLDAIRLNLIDGDPEWDGDGVANGSVADPGTMILGQRNFKGTNKDDVLAGNILANKFNGGNGNDKLIGDLGNDVLIGSDGHDRLEGGEGADLIIGGQGRDRIVYRSASDSVIGQSDTIRKLRKNDLFDLRQFESGASLDFIGNQSFSGTAGELRANGSSLRADLDGDGSADFRVNFTANFHIQSDQLLF